MGVRSPFVNPTEKTFVLPVGLFEFSAFEFRLEIEPALGALHDLVMVVAPDLENQIRNQSTAHAIENNLSVDDLMAAGRGAFIAAAIIGPPREVEADSEP